MNRKDYAMEYPLEERIGAPALFVERKKEWAEYSNWVAGIPKKISKSRSILARKKSGKTAFIQRLFNMLWCEKGKVIPFYIEVPERRIWLPAFADTYFRTFASQYISFLEREPDLVKRILSLEKIKAYGEKLRMPDLVEDVDQMTKYLDKGVYDKMWETAFWAPHRYASVYSKSVLVMIDEFQNLNGFICTDQNKTLVDETIPGSFHELSESKVAPLLVTGSAVGWLTRVIDTYLEAGRLDKMKFSPYLSEEDGLEAVYRYAEAHGFSVSNEVALVMNQVCFSDPYFIACVFRSNMADKDFSSVQGMMEVVRFETTNTYSALGTGWLKWFNRSMDRINGSRAKKMVLLLTKFPNRIWTPETVKAELGLDIEVKEVHRQLEILREADLIQGGFFGYEYQGFDDGTFYLMLQYQCKKELAEFDPSFRESLDDRIAALLKENASLQGRLNQLSGRLAEYQLAFDLQSQVSFELGAYFEGLEGVFEWEAVHLRYLLQNKAGLAKEFDLKVVGKDHTLLVEVKKQKSKTGIAIVEAFFKKVLLHQQVYPAEHVSAGILSLSGFTEEAFTFCHQHGIGTATQLNFHQTEWSI